MSNFKSYYFAGKKTEQQVATYFRNVEFSSAAEDRLKHFDMTVFYKIDVKGMKKIKRSDPAPNQHFHWVELKNVGGNKGWLYGEADFISFEVEDYHLIVDRLKLVKHIETHVVKEYLPEATPYKLYKRKGKKDVLTLVPTMDLCFLCEAMIPKEKGA